MKYILLLFFGCSVNLQYAQLETHTWFFTPTSKGIAFDSVTSIPTVVSAHTPLSTIHGCGVATNPTTGDVLFYSDGVSVYDENNIQMPNGFGLLSGSSCAQKGQIVLIPGSCDRFYLFCNNADDPASGNLYYSIVDMSLVGNGSVSFPKGDVEISSKNTYITNSTTEAFTIIQNPNGTYWLIIPLSGSDDISIYSITSSGISFVNTYNTGTIISGSFAIKYSKEAGKIAYISTRENQASLIMDFDPVTGIFSSVTSIPGTPLGTNSTPYYGFHDIEFSPDGTKLYMSKYRMSSPASAGRIYQYDFNFPSSPVVPVYTISSTDVSKNCTGLQTGPDGKIYFIYSNLTFLDDRLIGAINFPNVAGAGCGVNPTALDLGISQSFNSRFPEFVDFTFVPVVANNASASVVISCQLNYGVVNVANPSLPNPINIIAVSNGVASIIAGDSINYTSNPGFIGMDTIQYQMCDPLCFSKCDTGYVFVSVEDCYTNVDNQFFENSIKIYPNPSIGSFNVDCGGIEDIEIHLYDILGKKIFDKKLVSSINKIEIKNISKGVYMLKIINREEETMQRLIIE